MAKQVLCPNPNCRCDLSGKLTKAEIRTLLAQVNAAKRKSYGTGNPTKPRRCPHCLNDGFGARALKDHIPVCEANPRNATKLADVLEVAGIVPAWEGS